MQVSKKMHSITEKYIFAVFMNIAMNYRNFLQWNKVKDKDFQCPNKLFLRR